LLIITRTLAICCFVTDDSQGAARGYGPFHTEAEPTAHLARQDESVQPGHEAEQGSQPDQITSGPAAQITSRPADQITGGPADTPEPTWATGQTSGDPGAAWSADGPADSGRDPHGLDPDPWDSRFAPGAAVRPGPRIEPSPPPNRRRVFLGLIAGLAAGLIIFGAGGFILGHTTASPDPAPHQTGAPAGSLPIYEQSQVAINQPKFTGGVATLAQGWLPYLSGCSRSGQNGGPALNTGEKARVRCTLGGMSAIFVEYRDVANRDKPRVKALGQNVDARTLTPGVAAVTDKTAPSGRTTGNYVEYAYQVTESDAVRTVSGIWWDDAGAPVGAYLLAYWTEGIGADWAPMRDLWGRYA
jgi:hypothetical protein